MGAMILEHIPSNLQANNLTKPLANRKFEMLEEIAGFMENNFLVE